MSSLMLAIAATSSASAAGVSAQLRGGRAQDGCVAHVGPWCFLRDRIPCHDTSCQLPIHPDLNCTQLTDEQCAGRAGLLCASAPGCVAFGIKYTTTEPQPE